MIKKEISLDDWSKLSISTKLKLKQYDFNKNGALTSVSYLDTTRESTYFKFCYIVASGVSSSISTSDADSNGTQDYIDIMMTVFENVWETEIDFMCYTAPSHAHNWGRVKL